ncbi:NAD-dependent epimerase/dehydratase family protein [Cloacibacterium caeni]|jgi:UDP-glucuronate 4-epimerase|uniref:NAD-dependent epimerase/dehydratase family protein n=1 Tax=Cloacibacterium caeni TaxID=2004710 RepID=UPI001BD0B284|nr:NAD-dependent epimerase/dehydratase family protein [Cloacibacterium caeni]
MSKILVTGAAGFIGFHVSKKLIDLGFEVYGIDNLNAYYDVRLKLDRLKELGIDIQSELFMRQQEVKSGSNESFRFSQMDLVDEHRLDHLFLKEKFDAVINLAAQAGVRYSIENPKAYIQANVVGFMNILEACRSNQIKHLIYASSSSVYGNQQKVPFSEKDRVDHPISLYAATKKSNELMAHVYSHLYGLKTTGLRFFTVYGPWGRPDMAPFLFTKAILSETPIKVFNNGDLMRDFTYIEDIVKGIIEVLITDKIQENYNIYNIGNNTPVKLLDFIQAVEGACNKKAQLDFYPMQDGDVYQTFADIEDLKAVTGYIPKVKINEGIQEFVNWYKAYFKK